MVHYHCTPYSRPESTGRSRSLATTGGQCRAGTSSCLHAATPTVASEPIARGVRRGAAAAPMTHRPQQPRNANTTTTKRAVDGCTTTFSTNCPCASSPPCRLPFLVASIPPSRPPILCLSTATRARTANTGPSPWCFNLALFHLRGEPSHFRRCVLSTCPLLQLHLHTQHRRIDCNTTLRPCCS